MLENPEKAARFLKALEARVGKLEKLVGSGPAKSVTLTTGPVSIPPPADNKPGAAGGKK